MKPTILDHLPDGLLELSASELSTQLSGPTVIHLPGRLPQPLVVSVLQHGNETSGWEAIRRLLKGRYQRDALPRSLIIFIGNVSAAADNVRHLPEQPDLNRCWPGSTSKHTPWHDMASEITQHIKRCEPFGAIDIHNNTGRNPHYAAVNAIEPQRLHLACEFSKAVVYFTEPRGVQSQAFGQFCPAVTLECGLSNDREGADHAMAYLERALHLETLPNVFPDPSQLELYQMLATIRVAPNLDFQFEPQWPLDQTFLRPQDDGKLYLPYDLDTHNFFEWPRGFILAQYHGTNHPPITATGHNGDDLSDHCFHFSEGNVETKRPLTPAMLTRDPFAIRHDCLCYVMERLNLRTLQSGEGKSHNTTTLPEAIDQ